MVVAAGWASARGAELIPQTTAERYGLTRAWFAQVEVDRGRVRDIVLYEGTLYVQTSRAILQAIDAESGQTLWAKQIGRAEHPSLTPGVYHDLLATINGSRLYVLNRYTGDVLYETQVNGAPGAGAALSAKRAYVPLVGGMIIAYRIEPMTDPLRELGKLNKKEMTDEERKAAEKAAEEERRQNIRINQDYVPPLDCQSPGRALIQPLVTLQNREEEYCVWPTDRGYLNLGYVDCRSEDQFNVKYRLQTAEPIVSQPTYLPPDPKVLGDSGTIYAASADGYVYALLERSGELLWKFSAGEPVIEPAVVIEDRVFACAQTGGMYCLDAKKGNQLWWSPEIVRFLAASKHRVYTLDKGRQLRILDGRSGARLETLPTAPMPVQLVNNQTDRLYLATDTGLVQCLHELEQKEPIQYLEGRKPPPEEPPKLGAKKGKPGPEQEKPAKKPPAARPPAKKPAKKAATPDDAGGPDDAAPAPDEKPKAKAKAAVKKALKGKAKAAADAGGDNPFGGQ
jgi:hypothetical protein